MKEVDIISKVVGRDTSGKAAMYIPGAGAPSVNLDDYLLKKIWDSVFEIRTDSEGNPYLFEKMPFVTQYGITMYADGGELNLPSIYAGLPIDGRTLIRDDNGVLMINPDIDLGGASTWDELIGKPSWIGSTKPSYNYSEILQTPDLSVYALAKDLEKYVTLDTEQTIAARKNFLNGLSIGGLSITKSQDDVIYIDANLVVRGGITMYATDTVDVPSIIDSLPIASTSAKGLASFNPNDFSVVDGYVSFIGSTGVDESVLADYAKKTDLSAYLSLNGGQMTGNIGYTLSPDSYVIGLPAAGTIKSLTGIDKVNSYKSFIGSVYTDDWYYVLSIRHRNGLDDGNKYGLLLYTNFSPSANLEWNRQENGIWKGSRVILDSVNWSNYVTAADGGNYLPLSGGTMTGGVRLDAAANIYLQSTSGNNWNIFDVNGKRAFCVEAGGYVGIGRIYDSGKTYRLAVEGNAYIGGNGVLQKAISGLGTYVSLCLSSYYAPSNEIWNFELISDYYGANISDKGGLTHGVYFKCGRKGFDNFIFLDADGNPVARLSSQNTGIGNHLFGDLLTSGGITMYSDIRKKTKLQDVELSLKQIADAPLIEHYYNSDTNKTTHVGSIAQYWASMNDWFCKLDSEGYYTMEIQNAALASAISIARELVKYESKTDKEIRLLKDEVKRLKKEIKILKSA